MNTNWQDLLGASGARFDQGLVSDFGDLSAELAAASEATIISPLPHLGLIECTGEDAKSFLHNQVTSDINHLTSGLAQHSAWCTAKGRMLASFLFYRDATEITSYRALLSSDLTSPIQKRLQMFVLRSKVIVSDLSATHGLIGLSGPHSETVLAAAELPVPANAMGTATSAKGTVIRLDSSRFIIVTSSDEVCSLWTQLTKQARPAGTPVWFWLDCQAGIPLITEATKEAFVPQMANFDKIGGVSFHKGCYPGQEIVARTQYLGKVKRHLYRIQSPSKMSPGALIFAQDNPEHSCGMVSNCAPAPDGGFVALAVIQENFITETLCLDELNGPAVSKIELVA